MSESADAVIAAFEAWMDEPLDGSLRRRDTVFSHEMPRVREAWQQSEARMVAIIRRRLARLESLIERGKGIWPDQDYVRDETWDGWVATASELRGVLGDAGLEDA